MKWKNKSSMQKESDTLKTDPTVGDVRYLLIDSNLTLNFGRKLYGYAGTGPAKIHTFLGYRNISIHEGIQVIPYVPEIDVFVGKGVSILEDLGDHSPDKPPMIPEKYKPHPVMKKTEYVLDEPPKPISRRPPSLEATLRSTCFHVLSVIF